MTHVFFILIVWAKSKLSRVSEWLRCLSLTITFWKFHSVLMNVKDLFFMAEPEKNTYFVTLCRILSLPQYFCFWSPNSSNTLTCKTLYMHWILCVFKIMFIICFSVCVCVCVGVCGSAITSNCHSEECDSGILQTPQQRQIIIILLLTSSQ